VLVFDDALPGFGVRKFASGRASFFVKYSVGQQQRKVTLGAVVPGALGEMRRKASDVLARARLGQDVVADKKATQARSSATLGTLLPDFLRRKSGAAASYQYELKLYLERYWQALHDRPLESVSRREIVALLDRLAVEHGGVAADRAKAALSNFFGWALERSYIDASPVQNISRRAANGSRDRVLSEAELLAIWRITGDDDYSRILRLLILSAQRKSEIGDLQWPEINFERQQIELPGIRTKNRRPHLVPLSKTAIEILNAVPHRSKRTFLFGDGQRGFQGWSKAKARLDENLLVSARKEAEARGDDPSEVKIPAWTVHDIRRSVITHIGENGFAAPHVVEMLVNHISGHKGGVAGVYDKAQHLSERRRALNSWGAHIAALMAQ
jgi:integrase